MVDNQAALRKYTADLNEYCQKKQLKYDYKDVGVTGPPHDRIFTVMVVIEEKEYPPATGKSKREARKRAAKLAWETILDEEARSASAPLQQPQPSLPPFSPPSQLPQPASDVVSSSVNYIGFLNEYALKNKVYVQYPLMDKSGEEHKPNFSCACTVDGEIYGEGTGKNKQTAKTNAAKQAYEKLIAQSTSKTEQSAASINRFLHNSQEASEEASMNGMDSDLECKGINGKPATEIGASSTETGASSALGSPAVSAVKSKRRETLLAPTFSKLHQRENKYTTNEKFLDNFVDIEKIGSGGFGRVFKAKHKIDEKLRAVKRVELNLEEEMAEATREVKALADLKHDHIVRYYGCWIGKDSFNLEDSIGGKSSPGDCLFIEMEFCEKGTLEAWIDRKRKTKSCKDESLKKFKQIVEGVAYIHSEELVHRDIKPPNILISKEDIIKIGDFGLVTSGIDGPSIQRTQNRGTIRYMAPEQAGNSYGKEVDIFPLGLILFEMLYIFKTDYEKSREWSNIKNCKFPQMFEKEFPAEQSLIKNMLSEEPCKRPSATEILESLNQGEGSGRHTC